LLSTDTTLTAEQIVESYSLRWSIEPMFNQLKQAWGMKEAWQQTRQTLHRWVHITMAGYGLVQLLSCLNSQAVAALCQHSPWRKHQPQTAGQIRTGLVNILRHVAIRSWWNAKYKNSCHQIGIKTGIQDVNKATACNTTKRSSALHLQVGKNSNCGGWFTLNSSF
ncbi:transposase, partial [Nitrosomonas sp. Nm34]|uniref:transposase n=1 Tax=Nitrosomonas sp. Nm34 TaxID=1881055 RepID=UPI0008E34DAE